MKKLLGLAAAIMLSGCASSSVVVGTVRPPIDPEQVRLYVEPPPHYENVALLQASSEASFALTQQQKSNKAISRMKQEAADLGANGILLQGIGKEFAGSVGSGYGYGVGGGAVGFGSSAATYNQAGNGMAIYVYQGAETYPTPPRATGTRGAIEAPADMPAQEAPAQPAHQQPAAQPQQPTPPPASEMRWKPRGT